MLSSLAPNIWILSFLRLFAGIGVGATVPPLFTLCSELSPPRDRGFWVSVAASFWMVGSIYVAIWGWIVFAWWDRSWRLFAVICAFPALFALALVLRYVPESPRFLALQGQYEAALHSARWLAASMRYEGPELTKSDLLRYYPLSGVPSVPSGSFLRACQDFWKAARLLYISRGLVGTTLNLQIVWFALSFGSYGLLTWINLLFERVRLQNVYANALLFALANLPGNVASALLMDRGSNGRARLLTGSLLGAAISLLAFATAATQTATSGNGGVEDRPSRLWIVGSACAFQACAVAAWNAVDVISSELFPTQVRATGMGLCAASGRLGAMLAQAVNGYLVNSPARLLLVAASTLLIGAVSPSFLPDATGRPVEDRVGGEEEARQRLGDDDDEGSLGLQVEHAHSRSPSGDRKQYSYQRVTTGGEMA
jgi:MFS family permease